MTGRDYPTPPYFETSDGSDNPHLAEWHAYALRVVEERDAAVKALEAASEDARIVVQDYYSGLPEHRVPVDAAMARLAHLFESDADGTPRTSSEIVTEGMAERVSLASLSGTPEAEKQKAEVVSRLAEAETVIRAMIWTTHEYRRHAPKGLSLRADAVMAAAEGLGLAALTALSRSEPLRATPDSGSAGSPEAAA